MSKRTATMAFNSTDRRDAQRRETTRHRDQEAGAAGPQIAEDDVAAKIDTASLLRLSKRGTSSQNLNTVDRTTKVEAAADEAGYDADVEDESTSREKLKRKSLAYLAVRLARLSRVYSGRRRVQTNLKSQIWRPG